MHLRLRTPQREESLHRLTPLNDGSDRWQVDVALDETRAWTFRFEAFADEFATWAHAAELKIPAGVDVPLMRTLGAQLLAGAAKDKDRPKPERKRLAAFAESLADPEGSADDALAIATDPELAKLLQDRPIASLDSATPWQTILVERTLAGAAAWYEFFPRSEGAVRNADGTVASGTFATAAERLPAVAAMGFDVLYLPPIHPIGRLNRKGPNNTLVAGPEDPGSPWAVGAAEGGHDAIHPDLGTFADFRRVREEGERPRPRGRASTSHCRPPPTTRG